MSISSLPPAFAWHIQTKVRVQSSEAAASLHALSMSYVFVSAGERAAYLSIVRALWIIAPRQHNTVQYHSSHIYISLARP